jgi:hypothetical protein
MNYSDYIHKSDFLMEINEDIINENNKKQEIYNVQNIEESEFKFEKKNILQNNQIHELNQKINLLIDEIIKKEINRSQNFLIYNLEQLFYEIKIYKNETEDSNNHNITFSEFI